MKGYVLSLPERIIRSRTLRFVIEEVGGAEGVYAAEGALPNDFLARRTVGNVVEALGIVAFHLSPVWVLAAMSDFCGVGRQVIPEISDALKAKGLLPSSRRCRECSCAAVARRLPRSGSR
jgi:hypothetical protein